MGRLHGCTGKRSDVRYFLKGIPQHIVRPIFVVGGGHINIWYQFPFFKKEKVYETTISKFIERLVACMQHTYTPYLSTGKLLSNMHRAGVNVLITWL